MKVGKDAFLVQFKLPLGEIPDITNGVREMPDETDAQARARHARNNRRDGVSLLKRHGVTAEGLLEKLSEERLVLVDAYAQVRASTNGRQYGMVTFVFKVNGTPVHHDAERLLGTLLKKRWGECIARAVGPVVSTIFTSPAPPSPYGERVIQDPEAAAWGISITKAPHKKARVAA